jgi:DNA-directed RNA polymerase alpha subunit
VKTVVVGLTKEEEELELTVATNGAVKPRNALLEVLQLSQNFCGKIVNSVNNERKEVTIEE